MSHHYFRILGIVAVAFAFRAPAAPAWSQNAATSGDALIKINDLPTIEKLLTEPGVVVVDCFADW